MTPRPLVCLKNVSKSYVLAHGVVHALKSLNLEIHSGESVAIRGPSGSGKSTLLQLIGCLDRPTAGHYRWRDQDVSYLSDLELARIRASQMGFVFQSFNLIPQLTVFENIEVPFLYRSQSS
jgi:putative ABC transport system ATP-binding protein